MKVNKNHYSETSANEIQYSSLPIVFFLLYNQTVYPNNND